MEFNGSKTQKNLETAYCGESKARNNYTFFAEAARNQGYEKIAAIFEETANNEREHGKIWFKILMGDRLNSTVDNLTMASETEHYEWTDMYARFAQEAKEEGFEQIAFLFDKIRNIEEMHDNRYRKLIQDIKTETVFSKPEEVIWECAKCGYTHTDKTAPQICPFCKHPQAFFFVKCHSFKPDNY